MQDSESNTFANIDFVKISLDKQLVNNINSVGSILQNP